jgi:hypothetical protein
LQHNNSNKILQDIVAVKRKMPYQELGIFAYAAIFKLTDLQRDA